MTELPKPNYLLAQIELKREAENMPCQCFASDRQVLEIVSGYNLELIGYGLEAVVIKEKHQPTKNNTVIALDYCNIASPAEAKQLFYAHRIMSTLHPHNFPRFLITYGAHQKNSLSSGSLREEIEGDDNMTEVEFPFSEVHKINNDLDIPLLFDPSAKNYMKYGSGVYYVDKIRIDNTKPWQKDKIRKYMLKNKYSESAIKIVLSSIDRLKKVSF